MGYTGYSLANEKPRQMLLERTKPVGWWLYWNAPTTIQEYLLSGYFYFKSKRLHGGSFRQQLDYLLQSQWLGHRDLCGLQSEQLQHVISAASRIPYYQELFRRIGIDWRSIKGPNDLESIPLLEKQTVRSNQEKLVDPHLGQTFVALTSGTTGTPLRVYQDTEFGAIEEAFLERQYIWVGYQSTARHIKLRGDLVVRGAGEASTPWRFVRSLNELRMSSFHLSEKNIKAYVEQILAFRPRALIAYPSSAALLATLIKEHGLQCRIPLVFLSSEILSTSQRHVIEEVLDARVLDHYGLAEGVVAIQQCEFGSYHIISDYGITELFPIRGKQNEGLYEVVATGLWNRAMPFLRYRTGDVVRVSKDQACRCGRAFPTITEIIGRRDDELLSKLGSWVGGLGSIVFTGLGGIIEAQLLQHEDMSVTVHVVPSREFDRETKRRIVQRLRDRLGNVSVEIKRVPIIPRDSSGKFRAVVSELSPDSNAKSLPVM